MIKFLANKVLELALKAALVILAIAPAMGTFDVAEIAYSGLVIRVLAAILALTEDGLILKIASISAIAYSLIFKYEAIASAISFTANLSVGAAA